MGSTSRVGSSSYDYSFKVLLIGDSAVGKSSLLLSFISNSNSIHHLSPTIGTSFLLLLFSEFGFLFYFLLRKMEQGGTESCCVFANSTPLSRIPLNNDEGLFVEKFSFKVFKSVSKSHAYSCGKCSRSQLSDILWTFWSFTFYSNLLFLFIFFISVSSCWTI